MEPTKNYSLPPLWLALLPVLVLTGSLYYVIFISRGEPHGPLFLGTISAGLSAYFYGYTWPEIERGMVNNIKKALPSLLILLIIGMVISLWIASGIVPAMIYYGFYILQPTWFLPAVMLLCSLMSLVTGSSWTTIGTIGVAALGLGQGMGVPGAITAGAIVSGAFFGDKVSPMSDSTNLTPSILGVDLFEHIGHMLYTTAPAFILSLALYAWLGFSYVDGTADLMYVQQYQHILMEHFTFSFWLLIPPLVVISLVLFKVPALPSLTAGVLLGGLIQVLVQGYTAGQVFHTAYAGFQIMTGNEAFDQLLSRGGMTSMYSVVALGLLALAFGGIMEATNMLKSLVGRLSPLIRNQGSLVLTTLLTAVGINIIAANQYLAVIIPGQMFEKNYINMNLKLKNLSRALEAGGTLTAPLFSWNSSGAFILATLAVSPMEYLPYAFLCYLAPLIVALYAYANITMEKLWNQDRP